MIWTTAKSDGVFSRKILLRDPTCARCGNTRSTDCSHFWKRDCSGTRFDPRNGDGVCRECHRWWDEHRDEYVEFKRKQLGMREYIELQRLSVMVVPRGAAIIRFMKTQHA